MNITLEVDFEDLLRIVKVWTKTCGNDSNNKTVIDMAHETAPYMRKYAIAAN